MVNSKRKLCLVIHNVRSCHNVGSLLRTADGLGVAQVYMSGYTPYPKSENDNRLPHVSEKATKQIQKTALGAEKTVTWEHSADVFKLIQKLKSDGYTITALEQSDKSIALPGFKSDKNIVLVVGREVEGIEKEVLNEANIILEIPMLGKKESFNVSSAAAIALYHLAFIARD